METIASSGMTTVLAAVISLEILSLLMMLVIVHFFRSQRSKYRSLVRNLGNAEAWGTPGKFLLPTYIVLTVVITLASLLIFIFQPHLL